MQISLTLSGEPLPELDLGSLDGSGVDLDPQLVNFLQRNARRALVHRRYERLRTTTVKLQEGVRHRKEKREQQQIEGAARLVQSRCGMPLLTDLPQTAIID